MPRPRSLTVATEKNRNVKSLPGGRVINDNPGVELADEQDLQKTKPLENLASAQPFASK